MNSLTHEKTLEYIKNLNQSMDNLEWENLYQNALKKNIPVVRKETAQLLYFLVKIKAPKNILEIGTGSGYSSLWIHKGMPEGAHFTTLERDNNRYNDALELFKDYSEIELIKTDAFSFLKETLQLFDFIFLDSQKRDYIDFLPIFENKISPGGLLVADNFLLNGKIIDLPDEDKVKYQGGVGLLNQFNQEISKHPGFETLFLSLEDGVVLARRI